MAETKITYAEALTKAIETEGLEAEVVAKLEALKKSIEKKATNRKPTKAQKEAKLFGEVVEVASSCDVVVGVLLEHGVVQRRVDEQLQESLLFVIKRL